MVSLRLESFYLTVYKMMPVELFVVKSNESCSMTSKLVEVEMKCRKFSAVN